MLPRLLLLTTPLLLVGCPPIVPGTTPTTPTTSSTGTPVLVSGEVICDDCGTLVVALFDGPADTVPPIADQILGVDQTFSFRVDDAAGEYWLLGFSDDNDDGAPGPGERQAWEGPFDAASAPHTGIEIDLSGPPGGDDCRGMAADAVVASMVIGGHDVTPDGSDEEWDPLTLTDPSGSADPCDPGTSGGGDILGVALSQGPSSVGIWIDVDGTPVSDGAYVIELRPPSDASGFPDLLVMAQDAGPEWGGEVQYLVDGDVEASAGVAVAASSSGIEIMLELYGLDLRGWRIQVVAETPTAIDRTRWAPLATMDGVADDTNILYDPAFIAVVMAETASRGDLEAALKGTTGTISSFDDALLLATVASGTTDLDDALTLAALLDAEPTIDAAAVSAPGADEPEGLAWNALDALSSNDAPEVNWAHLQIETRHAQQVLWDCSYRLPPIGVALDIGVMDHNLYSTPTFPSSTVSDNTSPGTSTKKGITSHGFAVASVIGEASIDGGLDAAVARDGVKGFFEADRHAGILQFVGIDGWKVPYNLQLHNNRTAGAGGVSIPAGMNAIRRSGDVPDVVNASLGYTRRGHYCVDDLDICDLDAEGRCFCEGEAYEQPRYRCIGKSTGMAVETFDQAILATNRAFLALDSLENEDVLWVESAGNTCADVSGGHNSTGELNRAFGRLVAVGAVDRTLSRAYFSDHGSAIDLYAPGQDVLAWLPEVSRVGSTATLTHASRHRTVNGTSIASPLVAGTAGLVRWIQPTLGAVQTRDLLRRTGVSDDDLEAPVLNASRAVTRALLDRFDAADQDAIVTLTATSFTGACSVGPSEGPLASTMVVGCGTYDDETGTGGGSAFSGPEAFHTLTVTGSPTAGGLTIVHHGTDFSPGPGPSTTTFTTSSVGQEHTDIVHHGSVYQLEGTFAGGVVLRNPKGDVTDDCTWSGDFRGELYTTAD